MSAQLAEIDFGDGEGGENAPLLHFIYHLSCCAAQRGAGVGGVMKGLIEEALRDWAEEYEQ